jgi:hypothetical protein
VAARNEQPDHDDDHHDDEPEPAQHSLVHRYCTVTGAWSDQRRW